MNASNATASVIGVAFLQDASDWITIGVLSALFLVGAPVNLSIFFALTERLSSLTTKERLKLQLILSNLLILFVYAVSKICWHLSFSWNGGSAMCKAVKFGHELSFQFSSAILASIGMDRMGNVLFPFRTPAQIRRRVTLLIYASWAYAILLSTPQLWKFVTFRVPGTSFDQCTSRARVLSYRGQLTHFDRVLQHILDITHLVTVFWLPLLVMIVSYSVISSYIWKLYRITRPGYRLASIDSVTGAPRPRGRSFTGWRSWIRKGSDGASQILSGRAPKRTGNVSFNMTKETVVIGEGGELVAEGAERVEVSHWPAPPSAAPTALPIRTMKITLLLMSSYIICWTPYHITAIVPYMMGEDAVGRSLDLVWPLLMVLPSVLNPWIYGFFAHGASTAAIALSPKTPQPKAL